MSKPYNYSEWNHRLYTYKGTVYKFKFHFQGFADRKRRGLSTEATPSQANQLDRIIGILVLQAHRGTGVTKHLKTRDFLISCTDKRWRMGMKAVFKRRRKVLAVHNRVYILEAKKRRSAVRRKWVCNGGVIYEPSDDDIELGNDLEVRQAEKATGSKQKLKVSGDHCSRIDSRKKIEAAEGSARPLRTSPGKVTQKSSELMSRSSPVLQMPRCDAESSARMSRVSPKHAEMKKLERGIPRSVPSSPQIHCKKCCRGHSTNSSPGTSSGKRYNLRSGRDHTRCAKEHYIPSATVTSESTQDRGLRSVFVQQEYEKEKSRMRKLAKPFK